MQEELQIIKKEGIEATSFNFKRTILVSFLTFLTILVLLSLVVWIFKARLINVIEKEYVKNQFSEEVGNMDNNEPNLTGQESFVVGAVKKANPAVVAITISQTVPKYEQYNQQIPSPFGDFFGGNDPFGGLFSIPQLKQNGTEKKDIGGGSGFLVSDNGYIVTNKHVVDQKNAEYTVYLNNSKKYTAKVVAKDPVLDIAIIKIEPKAGESFPYLTLGNSDALELGQSVIAIGNALGEFRNSVSVGVVSGLARSITAGDGGGKSEQLDSVIQTDAAINPGNSGGPLLDLRGNVIGVNVAVAQNGQSIGFSLPINSVKSVIDSVKKTGKIIRPYLGLRYQKITDEIKKDNNLTVDQGVIVMRGAKASELAVIPGSPADKAGIVENDIITEVDGKILDDKTDLAMLIRQKNVGDVVKLKIIHKGDEMTVNVTLEQAPEAK